MTPRREGKPEAVYCPFLDEPCLRGAEQGLECQLRAAQDFDPMTRFRDFDIIYCAVCRKQIKVSELASFKSLGEKV
jgi:hypothetical protein